MTANASQLRRSERKRVHTHICIYIYIYRYVYTLCRLLVSTPQEEAIQKVDKTVKAVKVIIVGI